MSDEDLEMGEDGKLRPIPKPLTLKNAGEEIPTRMGTAAAEHLPKLDKDQVALAIMKLQNQIDQKAIPLAQEARQRVPGMEALSHALTYRDRGQAPAVRQPYQQNREFSSDAEKEAYLERIKQAQKNAAGK